MGKLRETNKLIDFIMTKLKESNPTVIKTSNTALLADIAGSLAIIADKLCEPDDKWIPVSEKLPLLDKYKLSDDVLITNGDVVYVGYLCREEKTDEIFWHYYESDAEINIKDKNNEIIAWRRLPEPYQVESEDKT